MSATPGAYAPEARRPIARAFRRTADAAVAVCVRRGIHPDTLSLTSVVVSALAAIAFWLAGSHPWLLGPAILLCYARLWLNMADGMVALAGGTASRRGEILNELPDRVSDVLVFVGVAHGGLCHPLGAYWVAILALLVAYVGTLGQAVGVTREFGGVMSKPWRMVALHVGAWATWFLLATDRPIAWPGGPTVLDVTHLVIALGCLQTIAIRLSRTLRALGSPESHP